MLKWCSMDRLRPINCILKNGSFLMPAGRQLLKYFQAIKTADNFLQNVLKKFSFVWQEHCILSDISYRTCVTKYAITVTAVLSGKEDLHVCQQPPTPHSIPRQCQSHNGWGIPGESNSAKAAQLVC